MSMKEIDNASTMKANATRGSAYTIHKYNEHLLNKPTTQTRVKKVVCLLFFESLYFLSSFFVNAATTKTLNIGE